MNFKGFKKTAEDEHFTTLRHYEGHEVKVAHKKLSKAHRELIKALPLKGEHVSKADAAAQREGSKNNDKQQLDAAAKADQRGKGAPVSKHAEPMAPQKFADGGQVPQGETLGSKIGYPGADKTAPKMMAQGGTVPSPKPSPSPQPEDQQPIGKRINFPGFAHGGQVQRFAPGGPVMPGPEAADGYPAMDPNAAMSVSVGQPGQALIPASMANAQPMSMGNTAPAPADPVSQATAAGAQPYGVSAEDVAKMTQATQQQAATAQGSAPAPITGETNVAMQGQGAAPNDPYGVGAYNEAYLTGLGEQKAGLAAQVQAESAVGAQQAKMLNAHIQDQQDRAAAYQAHYNTLENERQAMMSDLQNQHIDPMHYWADKSTGSKISTAIGLIVGGLSFNGKNGAMDFFNKNIDRDIEAQKAEMGKKENLLANNLRQFGNLRDATDMTRLMSMDLISNQLKMAAAKAAGPIARARALQMAGQLDLQAAPVLSQIAMRRTLVGGANAGAVDPSTVVRMIVPEHQQASAYKELKEAQDTTAFRDNLLGAFDKLSKINTLGDRIASPMQTPRQVKAIKDPLTAALSKNTAGRFTEQDAGMLETLWPTPGDTDETLAIKRQALQKMSDEKMHFPVLKSFGISVPGTGRYGMDGQKRIQLAPPVK